MINKLLNNFSFSAYKRCSPEQRKKNSVHFCANSSQTDTICLSGQNNPQEKKEINPEELKLQLDYELNEFSKNMSNMSRTELATEKYELCKWGSEIDDLRKIKKENGLSEAQQIRLNYLINKLDLIFQRYEEIEKLLMPFNPTDTVSDISEIPEHHNVFGFNQSVREAIESRANNFKGLSEEKIKTVLENEKLIEKLDKDFEQLPPLEHDCIVYKGLSEQLNSYLKNYNNAFELMQKAKVGDVVVPDTAYTYTAFYRSTAENWGGEGARHVYKDGKESRIMMYEIYLPKGAKVSRNFEHRGEVLMPRGAKYKIMDKKVLKNGDMEITLEYILPENLK